MFTVCVSVSYFGMDYSIEVPTTDSPGINAIKDKGPYALLQFAHKAIASFVYSSLGLGRACFRAKLQGSQDVTLVAEETLLDNASAAAIIRDCVIGTRSGSLYVIFGDDERDYLESCPWPVALMYCDSDEDYVAHLNWAVVGIGNPAKNDEILGFMAAVYEDYRERVQGW